MKGEGVKRKDQTSPERYVSKEKREGEKGNGNVHTISNLDCDHILSSPNLTRLANSRN